MNKEIQMASPIQQYFQFVLNQVTELASTITQQMNHIDTMPENLRHPFYEDLVLTYYPRVARQMLIALQCDEEEIREQLIYEFESITDDLNEAYEMINPSE